MMAGPVKFRALPFADLPFADLRPRDELVFYGPSSPWTEPIESYAEI
jgi:hypothetical protein